MNNIIKQLPPLLCDQIAAGEVVERPASVVKELLENAIDAKAKNITIEIENGGRSRISISDDGTGIDPEYIKTAFLPHATSKISTEDDLNNISTLGFRGEALSSISAVSRVNILTKTPDAEFAVCYNISAATGGGAVPAARKNGTTITVCELFYNTPARLKFLKKDVSEASAIADIITKIALSHPEISITFIRDGKEMFCSKADGDLLVCICTLLSFDYKKTLLRVCENGEYSVTGYISSPEGSKATRAAQYFFVNRRYIKSRIFTAALDAATAGIYRHGTHAAAFIFLTLPSHLFDANVHPTKIEVRFADEKAVFSAIYRAIKSALAPQNIPLAPLIFTSPKTPPEVINVNTEPSALTPQNKKEPADFFAVSAPTEYKIQDIHTQQEFYQGNTKRSSSTALLDIAYDEPQTISDSIEKQDLLVIGEIFKTYIVVQSEDKLLLIDKHAAHERIIYEQLIKQRSAKTPAQLLLSPITVEVSGTLKPILLEHTEYLESIGVELSDFGGNSVKIFSLPADIDGYNAGLLLTDIAKTLAAGGTGDDEKTRWVYHSIACRAAVKAGDLLHTKELLYLAREILCGNMPRCCPHGRPVVLSFTQEEIKKQFGRT